MKRSHALAPLSRDHHVALVVARELSRAGDSDAASATERYVRFLARHELAHFALEESVLVPALPPGERGAALSERLLEDHEFLRDALRRLQASPAAVTLSYVHEIGERLRAHVRMEEQELFPYLEQSLDERALAAIGAKLAQEPDGTEEPADVVHSFLDAVIARDTDALLALADPEIELHPLRLTATPAYTGHDGLRRWLADVAQRAPDVSFELQDVRSADADHAIARVLVRVGGEHTAAVTGIFTVASGTVREVHGYFSDEDLLSAVGIS
jgi:hemerythrin-like domain-containing protein/ketosteroid isomerase-like protein